LSAGSLTASPTTGPGKINEEICLDLIYSYSFSISDSFGDGFCCAEGYGSYVLKIGQNVIATGGDFGKSEQFWFSFQDCTVDSDCDDGDISTMNTCRKEAKACMHTLKACSEYGHMVSINATTNNFPEAVNWDIKDHNGDVKYEGGPYELSKTTYFANTCLADGIYTFSNLGTDFIGLKIGVGDDTPLVNEQYMWPDKSKEFVIGDPSTAPPTSASPTSASTTSNKLLCSCEEDKDSLTIEFMADTASELENKIFIDSLHGSTWKERYRLQNFDSSSLNTFNICLDKHSCHRLKITDSASNGICCEKGNGWYKAYWNGLELDHEPFENDHGREQKIFVGCPDSVFEYTNAPFNQETIVPSLPSTQISTLSSNFPSVRPSFVPSKKPKAYLEHDIESKIGDGCVNNFSFTSAFFTHEGSACNACRFCSGSTLGSLFDPRTYSTCIECDTNDNECKEFKVFTTFDKAWRMWFFTLLTSDASTSDDPDRIILEASNNFNGKAGSSANSWITLYDSDQGPGLSFLSRKEEKSFLFTNDLDFKHYAITFARKSDSSKLQVGHYKIIQSYIKECSSFLFEQLTGKMMPAHKTLVPTKEPTNKPTA